MEDKRRCKYPGCNAVLRSSNMGDYCAIHEKKKYAAEISSGRAIPLKNIYRFFALQFSIDKVKIRVLLQVLSNKYGLKITSRGIKYEET